MTDIRPFDLFQEAYGKNPDGFVRDCLQAIPDEHQERILAAVARGDRRISIRSGHGVGKTTLLAWIIIWSLLTKYQFKGVATAPTEDQLYDALAAEVQAWIERLEPGLRDRLEVRTEYVALKAAPAAVFFSFRTARQEKPEALQGIHSDNVLLIVDEASGVPEQIFEAGIGSMSGDSAMTILAGNPTRNTGFFYETFHANKDMWTTFHISCVNHERVSEDFIAQVRNTYGPESNQFRVRVLGEFPRAGDDTIMPRDLVEAAVNRDLPPPPSTTPVIWGLDCARFGDDRAALCKRRGYRVFEPIKWWTKLDTMQLAAMVHAEWKGTPPEERPTVIVVDVIGLGAGVVDRLTQLGLPVRGLNVSEASFSEQYINLRAELWFKARDWFYKRTACLPQQTELVAELCGVKFKFSPTGRLQVESKSEIKRRGERSPDLADAFILTFGEDEASLANGSENSFDWNKPLKRNLKSVV